MITKMPLTDRAYEAIITDIAAVGGNGFGWSKPASWFAEILHAEPQTNHFKLQMMEVKERLEDETGYYLSEEKDGLQYTIPDVKGHAVVVKRRRLQSRKRLRKSISLGSQTLVNPHAEAELIDADLKASLEDEVEKATVELYVIQHAAYLMRLKKKFEPKLLAPAPLQR